MSNREQYSYLNVEVEAGRKRLAEASAETTRAHQRTARLQADLTRLSQQLDLERSQQKLQVNICLFGFTIYPSYTRVYRGNWVMSFLKGLKLNI